MASLWDSQFAPPGQQITIIKEGSDPAFSGQDKSAHVYEITKPTPPYSPDLKVGTKGGRRTFPRGILKKTSKITSSRNPSKAPPTRRSVKLVTAQGIEKSRKTSRLKAAKMDIHTIRKKLIEKKIISSTKKNIPASVLRTLYVDSIGAGLLS